MKRKIISLILAALMVAALAGCGPSKAALEKLQKYEAELSTLENASLYDVISKKPELDEILEHEDASIFDGNDNWEFKEDYLESYSRVFTLAGTRVTVCVRAFSSLGITGTTYKWSHCSDTDALKIYNMIIDMYGEPDESELNVGAREGLVKGFDAFTWKDENSSIQMVYAPDLNTIDIT